MRSIERARLEQINRAGLDKTAVQVTGHSQDDLKRHLEIFQALERAQFDELDNARTRQWLYQQAERAGRHRSEVDKVIDEVMDAPSPALAAKRYAMGVTGDQQSAETGARMAHEYAKNDLSFTLSDRLEDRDKIKTSTQFHFEDQPRYEHDRKEAVSVRSQIESALREKAGVVAESALGLEQRQQRAVAYANSVADRIERRTGNESLRDVLLDNYDVSVALENKRDLGLSSDTMSDVIERVDTSSEALGMYESDIGS